MKIGIKFQVPNEWGNLIENILYKIDLEKYIWGIEDDDVYIEDNTKNNGFLFPQEKNIFSGIEFKNIISQKSYYTVFVKINAYLNENDFCIIKTYNDFKKSNCNLIILVTDNIFVSIYAKSENVIEKIKINAILNKYEKIEYITEQNSEI